MNRVSKALMNFRAFFTSQTNPLDRRWYLTVRIVSFIVTLLAAWTLVYWTSHALWGPARGYLAQLGLALSALVLSFAVVALWDVHLIRRARSPRHPTQRFERTRGKVVLGIFSVFALFVVSWSFVFLLLAQWSWFAGLDSGYATQLLAFLLCFFVAYGIMLPVGWSVGERLKEFSGVLRHAVDRIAQGDFSVNVLPITPNQDTHFDSLIEGINKMTGSLKTLEEMRREFVANVSHEIQSPLTNISGFAEALEDPHLPTETRQRYLSYIQDEARRLSRLSEHLLRLSSLDAHAQPLEPTAFRLDAQISEALLSLEPQWTAKNLTMDVDLAPVTIRANRDLLGEVWLNLVQNAVKFTPGGGRVAVRLTGGNPVEVRFSDSGIGLSPEDRARVFERFFKADPARSRSVGGSGLGLAIVKKIVELHGGSVTVESSGPERGSTFLVRLPAETVS